MQFPSRARRLAPPPTGAEPQAVPIPLGGSWKAGDPSTIPDGYVRDLLNMLIRPGPRYDSRPPAIYDELANNVYLTTWEDLVNQQTRFIAVDSSELYKKAASGETWDAGTSGLSVSRMTSSANYRGKLYMMFDDGSGYPSVAAVYDGTNLSVTPFNSAIASRVIVAYGDRLFLFTPRVTITPLGSSIPTYLYDWTSNPPFFNTASLTIRNITLATGAVECQFFPSSTTGSDCHVHLSFITSLVGSDDTYITWRSDLKGTEADYDVPFTIALYISGPIVQRSTAYVVGDLVLDQSVSFALWRCTTAGTTAAGAVVYNGPLGGTVNDGTAVFTCVKMPVQFPSPGIMIGTLSDYVPNITDAPDFTTFQLTGKVPRSTNALTIGAIFCYGHATGEVLDRLASIIISHKDGIADGDLRKKNFGQQFTLGSYYYPFVNIESGTSAARNIDAVIYSETSSVPPIIRAANTYEPKEAAGLATAGIVASKRLVMFKRRAFWVFALQEDPDKPILEESIHVGCGAISPLGVAALDDEIFWIAENECYRMRIGSEPVPICGDAMREEIMAKGANWVENLASDRNLAILTIDSKNREVYVYTQANKYYVYNLATQGWSTCDLQGLSIHAMAYNPVTTKMEISINGFGLHRLDDTVIAKDMIGPSLVASNITNDIIMRPIELFHPRAELCLHELGIYHLATVGIGDPVYVYTSNDRGATFPHFMEVQLDQTTPRIPISLYQFGVSVMPKIRHVGIGNKEGWSVSKVEAMIELLAGEWPWTQPPQLGSSL